MTERPLLPSEPGGTGFSGPERHLEPARPLRRLERIRLVARLQPVRTPRPDAPQAILRRASLPKQRNLAVPGSLMSQLMSFMPVVWIVWASIITILLVLLVYRSNLTRYEEDQIFLDDSGSHQKKEQEDILVKVNKIQPAIRIVTGVTCALTVGIIGVYVWDALQHLM